MYRKLIAAILISAMLFTVVFPTIVLAEDTLPEEVYADLGETPEFCFMEAGPHSPPAALKVVTRDGEEAWSTNMAQGLYVIGFNVSDEYYYDGDDTVYVKVRYFDEGTGKFTIQYDSVDNGQLEGEVVYLTGSNTWKEYTFVLEHAKFTNRSDTRDFLIGTYGPKMGISPSDLIISKVTVRVGEPFEEEEQEEEPPVTLPEEASADLGETPVFNFLTARPLSIPEYLKVVTRDGEEAWSTNMDAVPVVGQGLYSIGFDVDNRLMYDGDYTVLVKVRYYDEKNGKFTLIYDSVSAERKEAEAVQLTDSKTWKEYTFILYNARFADRIDGGDFMIGVYGPLMGFSSSDLIISSVTVKRLNAPTLDMRLDQVNLGNIFTESEPVSFKIYTVGNSITWEVYDAWGRKAGEGSEAVDGSGELDLTIPVAAKGYFDLIITAKNGAQIIKTIKTSFAVVSDFDIIHIDDSPFGVCTHFRYTWNPELIPLIAKMGVKSIRDELYWSEIELTKGVYTFPGKYETYMSKLEENNLNPLIILDYVNGHYDNGATPYTDEGRQGFANYGKAVIDHYSDQIRWVEVYNEFNIPYFGDLGNGPADARADYYFELLKKTYTEIKAMDPSITVVGPATSKIPWAWLEELFELGALDYLDAVSIHPYRHPDSPEGLKEDLERLEALIRQYNNGEMKPIWITEIGWPTEEHPQAADEKTQADYLVRNHVISLAHGVEKIYWYDFMNDGLDKTYAEHNFGLVRNINDQSGQYTPKPAYAAYAELVRQLSGAQFEDKEIIDNNVNVYTFDDAGNSIKLLWSSDIQDITLTADTAVTVIDIMGNEETYIPYNGKVYLTVSGDPVYVKGNVTDVRAGSAIEMQAEYSFAGEDVPVLIRVDNSANDEDISVTFEVNGMDHTMSVMQGENAEETIFVPGYETEGNEIVYGYVTINGNPAGRLYTNINVYNSYLDLSVTPKVTDVAENSASLVLKVDNVSAAINQTAAGVTWSMGELSGEESLNVAVDASSTVEIDIPVSPVDFYRPYSLELQLEFSDGYTLNYQGDISFNPVTRKDASASPNIDIYAQGTVVELMAGSFAGEDDLGGSAWVNYDEENFYFKAEIKDNFFTQQYSEGGIWREDCIQFAVTYGKPEVGKKFYEYGLALTPEGPQVYRWSAPDGVQTGSVANAVLNVTRDENTKVTSYELTLPWEELAPVSADDDYFSFSFLVNDNDGTGRKGWIEWGSGIGARKDSSVFMLMQLVDEMPSDEGDGEVEDGGDGGAGSDSGNGGDGDETGSPGSGASTPDIEPKEDKETVIIESSKSENESTLRFTVSLDGSFDEEQGAVSVKVSESIMDELLQKVKDNIAEGIKNVIEIKSDIDNDTVSVELPGLQFKELSQASGVELVLGLGSVRITLDREAIENIGKKSGGENIEITVSRVDNSMLDETIQLKVGDRPVFDFGIMSGDKAISDFLGGSIEISIPYTPAPDENPDAIVVYFIDDNNNLETVIGRYDEETGRVWFRTTHFSRFAVGYNEVFFTDVAKDSWYSKAINFMAARGIVSGIGNNRFAPQANVTRADFLIMAMNFFNIKPDYEAGDNFDDAGNTYYTAYLAAAKSLGLARGTGDNLYRPKDNISRQDMFVVLYRLLEYKAGLSENNAGVSLQEFEDVGEISDYALDEIRCLVGNGIVKGSGRRINPKNNALRSEAIQVLYNLYPRQAKQH